MIEYKTVLYRPVYRTITEHVSLNNPYSLCSGNPTSFHLWLQSALTALYVLAAGLTEPDDVLGLLYNLYAKICTGGAPVPGPQGLPSLWPGCLCQWRGCSVLPVQNSVPPDTHAPADTMCIMITAEFTSH